MKKRSKKPASKKRASGKKSPRKTASKTGCSCCSGKKFEECCGRCTLPC